MIQTEERRTFEQRYGTHCPFCGRNWSDPTTCGEKGYTIQNALSLLFAGNRAKECEACSRSIPSSRKLCVDCADARARARNRGNRHAWRTKTCEWCGSEYLTQKKAGRFCSLSHSMKARQRDERARAGQEELAA